MREKTGQAMSSEAAASLWDEGERGKAGRQRFSSCSGLPSTREIIAQHGFLAGSDPSQASLTFPSQLHFKL
jgi:hypothetical protein